MSELLNSLTSDNLVLLCVIMGIIALFLAVAISIEIFNNSKRYKDVKVSEDTFEDEEDINLNIKKDENIKYVTEYSELEKTKAKLELAALRERLKKEEEEKNKLIEMNLALSKKKEEPVVKEEVNKEEIKEEKVVKKEDKLDETLKKLRIVNTEAPVEPKKEEVGFLDDDDEENAIISYDELKEAAQNTYTDEEMNLYVDEKDAIISIEELEKLYNESLNIEVEETPKIEFEMKRVEDLPKISEEKIFHSTPFISPVYGTQNETDLVLEQTANLEKLNEEIKKTNEFLKTLKDLKKNLD